jgi:hypothetical protein
MNEGRNLFLSISPYTNDMSINRHHLKQSYGFNCTCTCCALTGEASKESDIRLTTMRDLYKRLGTWGQGGIDGREAIRFMKRIWAIGDEEGYTSERGRLAADAVAVAAAHSEYVPPSGLQKGPLNACTVQKQPWNGPG